MEDRAGGFVLRRKAFSDYLPRERCDYLPRCPPPTPALLPHRLLLATCQKGERGKHMESQRPTKPSKHVNERRATAQRAKLDAQAECVAQRICCRESASNHKKKGKREQQDLLARRRPRMTIWEFR